jgi:hypothetical protein
MVSIDLVKKTCGDSWMRGLNRPSRLDDRKCRRGLGEMTLSGCFRAVGRSSCFVSCLGGVVGGKYHCSFGGDGVHSGFPWYRAGDAGSPLRNLGRRIEVVESESLSLNLSRSDDLGGSTLMEDMVGKRWQSCWGGLSASRGRLGGGIWMGRPAALAIRVCLSAEPRPVPVPPTQRRRRPAQRRHLTHAHKVVH